MRAAAARAAKDREGMIDYERDHPAAPIGSRWAALRSWYWPWLSITRIPVTIALVFLVVWLVLFVTWANFARAHVEVAR